MKSMILLVALAIGLMADADAPAQSKVYTWTDSRGKLHITDEPPPVDASVRDVVEESAVTPAEARQRLQQRQQRDEMRLEDKRRSDVEGILHRAREADERAQEAVQKADEQTQRALEARKRFGNTPSRREQFKYRIRAEEEKAEAARAEAQRAIDAARTASEEARAALNQPPPGKP
jgi:hypothetical protein